MRNPHAVRPWQHVLEPLSGYLMLGSRLLSDDASVRARFSEAWNFGPDASNVRSVRDLVEKIVERWGSGGWHDASDPESPHEAGILRLSIDKVSARLGWSPKWNFDETVGRTIDWYKGFFAGENTERWCQQQIADYSAGSGQ